MRGEPPSCGGHGVLLTSREVANYISVAPDEAALAFKDALDAATGKPLRVISATGVTARLKPLVGTPVRAGGQVLRLHFYQGHSGGSYEVKPVR